MPSQVIKQFYEGSLSGSIQIEKIMKVYVKEKYEERHNNISSDVDLCMKQGYACHDDYLVLAGLGNLWSYYIEVCIGDIIQIDPLSERAIALPFSIKEDDEIGIGALDIHRLDIPVGTYQVLYEVRFLLPDEWGEHEKFKELLSDVEDKEDDDFEWEWHNCPEFCRITFIPTPTLMEPRVFKGRF